MPRWRRWADGWTKETAWGQYPEYAAAVGAIVMRLAATALSRWAESIDGLIQLGPDSARAALDHLEGLAQDADVDSEECFSLWRRLHENTTGYRRYDEPEWSFLPRDVFCRCIQARDRFKPSKESLKNFWLFSFCPRLPGFDDEDTPAYSTALHGCRLEALKATLTQEGIDGILTAQRLAEDKMQVGWIIGGEKLLDWAEVGLPDRLDSADSEQSILVGDYIRSRFEKEGWSFVESLPLSAWTSAQAAIFMATLPFRRDVWRRVEAMSPEAEERYWEVATGLVRDSSEDLEYAVSKLLGANRADAAIRVLEMAMHCKIAFDNELGLRALEDVDFGRHHRLLAHQGVYGIQQLLKHLQDSSEADLLRLATLEWKFLAILRRRHSKTQPNTLLAALREAPALFAEIIQTRYRRPQGVEGDPSVAASDVEMRMQIDELMRQLTILPGTREDGSINTADFHAWLEEVRSKAESAGVQRDCDVCLGRLFAQSRQVQGEWPPLAVSEFLESSGSDELFTGFKIGVKALRGQVWRNPTSGGSLEREIAERYAKLATEKRALFPRVSAAFDEIAESYSRKAADEDRDAERERLGR